MQELLYAPLWNVRKGVVSHYIALFASASDLRDAFAAHKNFLEHMTDGQRARCETDLLVQALDDAQNASDLGRSCRIICPVSYNTLLDAKIRKEYESLAAKAGDPLSCGIGFLVFGFPRDPDLDDIVTMTQNIRNSKHMLLAEFSLDAQINFNALRAAGFDAVGIHPQQDATHRLKIGVQMDLFFTKARRNFIPYKFALGVPDLISMNEAICSGFDYLEGGGIMPPLSSPVGTLDLKQSEVYQKYFSGQAE